MSQILTTFQHRPTFAEIDLGALERNFAAIQKLVGATAVMPVVKANAYGHGLVECGLRLEKAGATILGVAYLEEAAELRKGGVTVAIHVFGGILTEQVVQYLDLDVDITAPSVAKLQTIDEAARLLGRRARVHLKIDTGLERLGIHYYSAKELFDAALQATACDVVGVFSHFAAVDSRDLRFTQLQLERFKECLRYYEDRATHPFKRHIASSAALTACPESRLDMVRPGLLLYGVYPEPTTSQVLNVEPVLSLKSQVVYFKVVKAGSGVSYGLRWIAPEDSRIVTIPIGYGDGYSRRMTNVGEVLIRGSRYPVVGAVCMDQLMVNLGAEGTAYNGDEVVFVGVQGDERISVEEIAAKQETIPWEVLVTLNQRIPRIYQG